MDIAFRMPRLSSARTAAARVAGTLIATVRRWWRWRIERWELLSMTDHELRDIGLTRLDARRQADKPFRRS